MQITVSGKFSHECSSTCIAATEKLRAIIDDAGLQDVTTELSHFVFFPVIISDEFPIEKKSHRSHSRKEGAEFVNVEIDWHEWSKASEAQQLELMMGALNDALRRTRPSRIGERAKEIIIARLQTAFEARLD